MNRFLKYASFIKLEHALFSLPLLFAGAVLGNMGWPSFRSTILIIFAGVTARNVAMIINRIIDREVDLKNPRTKDRHLPSGKVHLLEAWALTLLNLGLYLVAVFLISEFCLKLAWIPLLAFGAYPFFKRFTKWTHLWLGLIWSMVPIAGFFAVHPSVKGIMPVLILAGFSVFWLSGFDIIYATLDEEFDRGEGLHSLPSRWGSAKALRISLVFHILAFLFLMALYLVWFSGPLTLMLLVSAGALLTIEHQFSYNVDVAFFRINVFLGFIIFLFVLSGVHGV